VAYIDVKPGMTVGHIRCKNAESAAKLVRAGIKGCSVSLVEGGLLLSCDEGVYLCA